MAAGLGLKAVILVVVSLFLMQGVEGHFLDYKHLLGNEALDNCTRDLMLAYGPEELKDLVVSLLKDMQPTWKEVLYYWIRDFLKSEPETNDVCMRCHENRQCKWSVEQSELKQQLNDTVRRLYGQSIAFNLGVKCAYLVVKALGLCAGVYTAGLGVGTDLGQYALEHGGYTITAKIVGLAGNTLFTLVGSRKIKWIAFAPIVWVVAETQFEHLIEIFFNHTHLRSHLTQVVLTKFTYIQDSPPREKDSLPREKDSLPSTRTSSLATAFLLICGLAIVISLVACILRHIPVPLLGILVIVLGIFLFCYLN